MSTLLHDNNTNKMMRLLANSITWVLVAIIAVMLASLLWLVLTPQAPLPKAPVATRAQVKASEPIVNYGPIVAKQHLFGWIPPKAKPIPKPISKPKPKSKPKPVLTKLNLKIYGIIARTGKPSYVILSSAKDPKQKIYGVGEEPQKSITIHQILPKKIILKNGEKLEELRLPEKKIKGIKSRKRSPVKRVDSRWNFKPTPVRQAPVAPPPDTTSTALAQDSLPNEDISALRDALTVNPEKLLDIARISESKDKDGNLTGFRLSPGKNRKLFRSLGLRPGDVVTQVNGITLSDPSKGLMVMNELQSATSISLTIKRADQMITIEKQF
ncbi:MAG: type II secretion system protein GspC [Gammaproteobacteria bacterium]|nr:type II secretion system protein GspC [Gammaproteobacteria bacterium]